MKAIRRPAKWSIRGRLVAALMVVTVVGFVIFGAISTLVLERLQEVRLDGQLDVIATDISGTSQPPPKSLPEGGPSALGVPADVLRR